MRILCVGDVVGSPGRRIFKSVIPRLKSSGQIHAVVVNAENSAGGKGITAATAEELFSAGADVITLGDHTWDQKDTGPFLDRERRVVRPSNFPASCPGRGWTMVSTPIGDFAVVNIIGRTFMSPSGCPFAEVDRLLCSCIPHNVPVVCDFHAEATSEKVCMGFHLDGRVSAVFGTHTHVQTSDAKILPNGTGYITDLGMTGPEMSVLGRDFEPVYKRFSTGMPAFFSVSSGSAVLEGCIFDVDRDTFATRSVECVRMREGT